MALSTSETRTWKTKLHAAWFGVCLLFGAVNVGFLVWDLARHHTGTALFNAIAAASITASALYWRSVFYTRREWWQR